MPVVVKLPQNCLMPVFCFLLFTCMPGNHLRRIIFTRPVTVVLMSGFSQVLYYIYAIVGMELFGNLIKTEGSYPSVNGNETDGGNLTEFCGNIKLKDSDFYADRYCNNNFNNILRSFKVLFDLMVVNQWHSILYSSLSIAISFLVVDYFLFLVNELIAHVFRTCTSCFFSVVIGSFEFYGCD